MNDSSDGVTHQVFTGALRMIFVGRRQLNFNLTEKYTYRHHQQRLSPVFMNKIQAKYLATGDRVRFSRDGWQTVGRITNCNSISVSFMFSDGIIRKLEAHQEYVVETAEKPPEPQPGQIMRLNKETNRISVCASHSLNDLSDISESFRAIKQHDRYSNSAVAYHELERGATLHTRDGVYWMPLKWSGEATKESQK